MKSRDQAERLSFGIGAIPSLSPKGNRANVYYESCISQERDMGNREEPIGFIDDGIWTDLRSQSLAPKELGMRFKIEAGPSMEVQVEGRPNKRQTLRVNNHAPIAERPGCRPFKRSSVYESSFLTQEVHCVNYISRPASEELGYLRRSCGGRTII